MTKRLKLFIGVALLLVLPTLGFAQAALTFTTLSAAVISTSTQTIRVASATGFVAGSTMAYVDQEALRVTSVSGLTIGVIRGQFGTVAATHHSGQMIYVGPFNYFSDRDYSGSCTASDYLDTPLINVGNGNLYICDNGQWSLEQVITSIKASYGNNLDLETVADSKPVTINSRNYTQVTGSSIGFQVKPTQTVSTAGNVIGGEVFPRVNSGIAVNDFIGLFVSPYLKGTAVGNVNVVRGLQVQMSTDDSGTRTVAGDVSAISIHSHWSGTISGFYSAIKILDTEDSKVYDAVLQLDGMVPLVWNNDPGTEVNTATATGYIGVIVGGLKRYIPLIAGAPTD